MKRMFFNGIALFSSIILMLVVWACIRSATKVDEFCCVTTGTRAGILVGDGGIEFRWMRLESLPWSPPGHSTAVPRFEHFAAPSADDWTLESMFHFSHDKAWFSLMVPFLALFAITALTPGLWLASFCQQKSRARRQSVGYCIQCGYDLRASKTRCPECGILIAKPDQNSEIKAR